MTLPDPERVDDIAREFRRTYEALAPEFGYSTRRASAVDWDDVPTANKSLMRAVVASLLHGGVVR